MSNYLQFPIKRTCPIHPPDELREIREAPGITRVRLWDGSFPWLVTRYDDVRELLTDPRLSADGAREGYPAFHRAAQSKKKKSPTFISMDEPEHGRLRKMVLAPFGVRRVEAMRPEIERLLEEQLDILEHAEQPADFMTTFALPFSSKIICLILGVPYSFHTEFQHYAHVRLHSESSPDELDAADDRMDAYLLDLANQRREDPRDDLVTHLVTERLDTGELSIRDMLDTIVLVLTAGHDTTANTLGMGILSMFHFPEQAELLRTSEDEAVINNAVEDLLRFVTPTHLGRRRVATEDIEFQGQTIKAGDGVIMVQQTANRDPEKFENPEELDFARSAKGHLTFGFGVHQCLGQTLARLELQLAFPAVVRRFPNLRLGVPEETLRFTEDMVVLGPEALPVRWDEDAER